jgi:hypothetical protein
VSRQSTHAWQPAVTRGARRVARYFDSRVSLC